MSLELLASPPSVEGLFEVKYSLSSSGANVKSPNLYGSRKNGATSGSDHRPFLLSDMRTTVSSLQCLLKTA